MTRSASFDGTRAIDLDLALERERAGLTGYCYRMLGSSFEAEDAVQEALLRAWRSFAGYEGRAPLHSWLYRIATNVCIDMLNGRRRRALPMDLASSSNGDQPAGPATAEAYWIQPMPDHRILTPVDPAEAAASGESVRLAFIAALQHLQPRSRAIVIVRDVLGWRAIEAAELLDMTPAAVHSTLRRARRTLAASNLGRVRAGRPLERADELLLARYVGRIRALRRRGPRRAR